MLEELRISGLGVIAEAVIEPGPGLTVVTGETGAGKTMLVSALELLLGGRGDGALVRSGTSRALVEGSFSVDPRGPLAARAVEAGALLDDGELIVGRTLAPGGRSRAQLGGRTVPVSLLAELADRLVARHSQADQFRLTRPGAQRAALDRFAGEPATSLLAGYAERYARHRESRARLDELRERGRQIAQEADLLRHGLAEISRVAPRPGEDAELVESIRRLEHADALRVAAEAAGAALSGGDPPQDADALGLLGAARRALDAAAGHDPELDGLAARLAEACYLLADLAADLASYAAGVEADPGALAAAQERRAALAGLTRRYGADVAEVLAWAERAEARLAELDLGDDAQARLQARVGELAGELARLAGELTATRRAAGDRFAEAVTGELAALAMPHARLQVALRAAPPGPAGADEVELLLSAHPGAPPRPVGRAASGGELSRIMLALEVVLAGADPVPTFVFDEVDAGVGGRAAVEVGRRLARLAEHAQVLVVTHLPQVAAFAECQYVVEKNSTGVVTASDVRRLEGDERVRELTRMLAGLPDSELGRGHAEELLDAAAASRSGRGRPPPRAGGGGRAASTARR